MKLSYKKSFAKSFNKLDEKIKIKFKEKIGIFEENPKNQILKNHGLNGNYEGFRSINITGDFRAIFREYPTGTYEFVDFIEIGNHSELY